MSERTIETVTKKNIPELLAPVGGQAQLEAAINNGADAVYMGGALFNARMKADNFGGEKLRDAIDYAHTYGAKAYITLNTLIKDSELKKAFEYACGLYEAGADAVILQDMGLARLIHRYLPDFPMHLSTQGTVYNRSGLEMAADLGFSRVVPARELSLDEIEKLCRAADGDVKGEKGRKTEVEVFVHGALCMCYSGQCQMSRILGGGSSRSGNRGLCAQPCRLKYKDDRGELTYALSPKDICTLEDIPALCEAGADSLKIEGRLKSAEYVATVTRIYRKYLDMYAADNAHEIGANKTGKFHESGKLLAIEPQDSHDLLQIFNRGGFTKGYLYENPGKEILSGSSPKNMGIYVGDVISVHNTRGKGDREGRRLADVKLTVNPQTSERETIAMGDGIELSETGNVVTYLEHIDKGVVRIGDFKETAGRRIRQGEKVFKVTDKALMTDALLSDNRRKSEISMNFTARIGETPVLDAFADGNHFKVKGDGTVEKAIKRPADPERIKEQLGKLGGTPFEAGLIDVQVDEAAMVPVSAINEMRRQAVEMIAGARRNRGREAVAADITAKAMNDFNETCPIPKTTTFDFALVPLEEFMSGNYGRGYVPYVINVTKGNCDRYLEENFDSIVRAVEDRGIVLGNLGWIREFRDAGVKVYGDYGLNVYNRQAEKLFDEIGVEIICWSDEMSISDKHCSVSGECRTSKEGGVADGPKRFPEEMENIPLMITEHPLRTGFLTDRKGVKHKVIKWYSDDKYLIF